MRIIALPDIHVPFNIPLRPVWKFVHDFRPDVVVLLGDVHDFTAASHWISNQSGAFEKESIKESYDQLTKVVLDPLRAAAPRAIVKYLRGNHEDWLDQVIALNKNGRGYWEIENNVDLRNYHIEMFPVNFGWEPCENLVYTHGVYTGIYHARQMVQAYHNSVLYGHVHDVQSFVQVSPVHTDKFYKASSIGCLSTTNPHYLKNRPNRHVNGFNFAYINERTGAFNDFQVIIVKGGFWANGKYYR